MEGEEAGPAWESQRRAGPEPGRGKTGLEAGLRLEVVVRTAVVEASAKLGLFAVRLITH